ncbi:phosphotransferase family protein [Aquihabitans sp. McL0605]|uniref:phosphotransferase family protein n=1 Tax=Aquihabitans sp. McL0605 TaxID=3415671 RepID=UPI003CEC2DEB
MEDVVDVEGLTAVWLSGTLGSEVRSVAVEQVGTGQTAATYRLALDAPDLPSALIAKVATGDAAARERVSFGYQNEVGFYAHVAETVDVQTPRCSHAAISADGLQFTLLLEDLTPRVPGVQADGCPADRAEAAVRNLAGLHAPRWCDPELHHLEFLSGPTATDEESAAFLGEVATGATEEFIERYAADLADADAATLRDAAAAVPAWLMARPEPFSVVHGDYRLDNLMFGADADDVVAVDWQTLSVGPPLRDVAYFLGTSITTEARRADEVRLVATYHDALVARGIEGYSADRCFEDYRIGQLHGPLITTVGAIYSPAARSAAADEMFLAMARRTCAAIRDLGSIALL